MAQRGRTASFVLRWQEYSGIDLLTGDPEEIYELKEMVGRGAYGAVWKALDRRTLEPVALKLIPVSGRDDGMDAVRREITILKDCRHPNVVRYEGSYLADNNLWIVMEFCGGRSVSDIMADIEGPLQEPQIAIICREALKALAYLHQKLKIHRDVKCSNILLTEQAGVKLADFGVSAQLVNALSCRNSFVGTSLWMAPEVIQEQFYNGRADVWSLGVSCLEMAEVNPPLAGQHPFQCVLEIKRNGPPTFTTPERWSTDFRDFTRACLTPDQDKRPTAEDLLHHPFIVQAGPVSQLLPLLESVRELRRQQAEARQLRALQWAEESTSSSDSSDSVSGSEDEEPTSARKPSASLSPTRAVSGPASPARPKSQPVGPTEERGSLRLTHLQALLTASDATVLPLLSLDVLPTSIAPEPLGRLPLDARALAQMLVDGEPLATPLAVEWDSPETPTDEERAVQLRLTPSLFNVIKCYDHTLRVASDPSRFVLTERQWAAAERASAALARTLGVVFQLDAAIPIRIPSDDLADGPGA